MKWVNPKSRAKWKFNVTWIGGVVEHHFPEGTDLCFDQAKRVAVDLQKTLKRGERVRVYKSATGLVQIKELKPLRKTNAPH